MKRNWEIDELIEHFTFLPHELQQIGIKALELIKKHAQTGSHYFPSSEVIPVDGVIRSANREIVIEKDDNGQERINRINYEISNKPNCCVGGQ